MCELHLKGAGYLGVKGKGKGAPYNRLLRPLGRLEIYSSTQFKTSALKMGVGGQHHAPASLPPGKSRHTLYRRLGGHPGPVWTGAENLTPTRIRSPDRSARSESLYRLSYPDRLPWRGPQQMKFKQTV